MQFLPIILSVLFLYFAPKDIFAQQTLTTTYAGGFSTVDGNMFNIVAINDITVLGFESFFSVGNLDAEIYVVKGSYLGNETNPSVWQLVGTQIGITSNGVSTPLSIPINLSVSSGDTIGFYITNKGGSNANINYTGGTTVNSVYVSDANLQILEGHGVGYPFANNFSPRVWNGTIYYSSGLVPDGDISVISFNVSPNNTITNLPTTFNTQIFNADSTDAQININLDYENDGVVDTSIFYGTISGYSLSNSSIITSALVGNGSQTAKITVQPQSPYIDALPFNNTKTADYFILPNCISTFPYTENFDSFSNPLTISTEGWENASGDDFDWSVNSGTTPSQDTGPIGDHTTGNGNYLYTEASNPNFPNKKASLISPCFDLTGIGSPEFEFWLHQYGISMGELHLDLYDVTNNTWINDFETPIIGSQQNSSTAPWIKKTIDLTNYSNLNIRIRFRAITGNSFDSDICIDDISLHKKDQDLAITNLNLSTGFVFQNSQISFDVNVSNLGLGDVSGFVEIDFENDGNFDAQTNFSNLSAGNQQTIIISGNSPQNIGTYTAFAKVTLLYGVDSDTQNDTMSIDYDVINSCINSFPYTQNFDSLTNPIVITNDGWENIGTDDFDWIVNSGTTSSNNTGPIGDQTSGTGNYLYTEATDPNNPSKTAIFLSPCFDLTNLSNPEISFWYHMYGSGMGELHLDVFDFTTNSWTNDFMPPLIGEQQNSSTSAWLNQTLDFSVFANTQIRIRMKGITGSSFTSDICIDDFEVREKPGDIGIVNFTSSTNPIFSNAPMSFDIVVQNFGGTVADFTVEIDIENDGTFDVSDAFGGLAQNLQTTVTLNANAPQTGGNKTAKAKITLSNGTDVVASNDTMTFSYFTTPPNNIGISQVNGLNFGIPKGLNSEFNITVENLGISSASGNVTLDINGDGNTDAIEFFSNLPSSSQTILSITTAVPQTIGTFTAIATANLTGATDGIPSDDSGTFTYNVIEDSKSIFPYAEGFTTFSNPISTDNWENVSDDDFDWIVDLNGTPSPNTGPNGDNTTGNGKYLYTEASGNNSPNKTANILSPPFDLVPLANPELKFWFHMYGSNIGELHIDVFDLDSLTWTNDVQSPLIGEQQISSSTPWIESTVNLSAFTNSRIRVRFRGITGNGVSSDMAIDDISIIGSQPFGFSLNPSLTEICAFPGWNVQTELAITNSGGNNDSYQLTSGVSDSVSLSTQIIPSQGGVLQNGESETFIASIEIPLTSSKGSVVSGNVFATSDGNPNLVKSSAINLTVADLGDANCSDWILFQSTDSNLPLNIPDNGSIFSTCNVANNSLIGDLNVYIDIEHTFVGDLDITLIAPNGNSVFLTSDNGGSGDNLSCILFDDEASISITNVTANDAPFTNAYIPESSLGIFDGIIISGTWLLQLTDDAGGDVGKINRWGFYAKPTGASGTLATPTLTINENGTLTWNSVFGATNYSVHKTLNFNEICATIFNVGNQNTWTDPNFSQNQFAYYKVIAKDFSIPFVNSNNSYNIKISPKTTLPNIPKGKPKSNEQ